MHTTTAYQKTGLAIIEAWGTVEENHGRPAAEEEYEEE